MTVGNTYEAIVLRGIADVGDGSVRNIGGERTPQLVAQELLSELTQPGLRDVHVEFRGLQVAAIYPEHLPSVPTGTQQIVVGRYLPTGADQHGEVVVTAKRGSESVRYAAKINLKDADDGNSFIPRMWARAQLDHLLQQGPSEAIQDQIIALSEEFHIITPYTSLLVLESDTDRERFGVKKRFAMRDGERFFAEGRNSANFELLAQQMKRAGDWRLRLRYQVLRELAGLGRNPQIMQQQLQMLTNHGAYPMAGPFDMSGAGAIRLLGINTYAGNITVSGGSVFFDTSPQAGLDGNAQLASQSESIGGFGGGGGGGFRGGFIMDGELPGRAKDLGELDDSAADHSLDETGKIDLDGQRLDWDTNGAMGGVNDLKKLPSQGKQEWSDEPLEVGVTVAAASDAITINGKLAGEYENTGESGPFGYAADVPISVLRADGISICRGIPARVRIRFVRTLNISPRLCHLAGYAVSRASASAGEADAPERSGRLVCGSGCALKKPAADRDAVKADRRRRSCANYRVI